MERDDDFLRYSLVDSRTNDETQIVLAKYQLIYSVIGLLLGLSCILGGIFLFALGVTGAMSRDLLILGSESKIINAAPGAVLFIVGLFLVVVTKYKFKHVKAR